METSTRLPHAQRQHQLPAENTPRHPQAPGLQQATSSPGGASGATKFSLPFFHFSFSFPSFFNFLFSPPRFLSIY
jgi:alkanesulfonate monooxygenase SsuD/methylene tetrahydromethanopterin reductase-like flavin-dependent oxidoreductase (luciferase family)